VKRHRLLIPFTALSLALAACGGGPATQVPAGGQTANPGVGGGTPTDAPEATDEPVATQSSGGGGGGGDGGPKPAGWDQYGKVHIELSGPVTHAGDYGFIPAGSYFGGAQGSTLNFTIDGSNEIVAILASADGTVIVSYGSVDMSVPASECTTSNWNIGATSASGSFDCKASLIILSSGATLSNGTLKGTFDAHAL
jgi:hypothetical protein